MVAAHPLVGYRESEGLSRAQLAERLGVTDVTIWRWECYQREPRGKMRRRLAALTGIPESQLVGLQAEAAE